MFLTGGMHVNELDQSAPLVIYKMSFLLGWKQMYLVVYGNVAVKCIAHVYQCSECTK